MNNEKLIAALRSLLRESLSGDDLRVLLTLSNSYRGKDENCDALFDKTDRLDVALDVAREALASLEAQPVAHSKSEYKRLTALGVDVAEPSQGGWVLLSADFSLQAAGNSRFGDVTLIRDLAGRKHWHSLSDEQHEQVSLYVYGSGKTFQEAEYNAYRVASELPPMPLPAPPTSDDKGE